MQKEDPAWLIYQRCVAAFAHEKYGDIEFTVQPNVFLKGKISQTQRQIDVLIDARFEEENPRRIIVDAKNRKSKVDINDVEAFAGMMQDCQATHGVFVCTSGYTDGAKKRAGEFVDLQILTLEDALSYEWIYQPCLMDCQSGMVFWEQHLAYGSEQGTYLLFQTGICDTCHSFHIWCWGCGKRFAILDEAITLCDCEYQWCSLIEANEKGEDVTNWLVLLDGTETTKIPVVNRKNYK